MNYLSELIKWLTTHRKETGICSKCNTNIPYGDMYCPRCGEITEYYYRYH